MNTVLIKNLRLIMMLRAYLLLMMIPVYFFAFYFSPPIKGILYVFTTVIVFGPLVSMQDATDFKNKTHMIFFSLPVNRKDIVMGNFYTAYSLLGLVIALVFLGSVLMHLWSPQWKIMTFGEILFILTIVCLEDLLETCFNGFYYDTNDHPFKLIFAISLFFLLSFLVYPYLIASISRLDFSWPKTGNPMQLTLDLFNKPLPALIVCILVGLGLGLTLRQKIHYFENKDL
ncbi:MAG: ABC-2 transporter permease [Phycisphaerae bacterium]|nr:ABC-2 transporter permease [Phycisphaerae bacterium]